MLGSAAARSQTSAFGEDAYPDLSTKAAPLPQSILKSHALVDGNERRWLATATFLEINGIAVTHVDNDAVHDFARLAVGVHRHRRWVCSEMPGLPEGQRTEAADRGRSACRARLQLAQIVAPRRQADVDPHDVYGYAVCTRPQASRHPVKLTTRPSDVAAADQPPLAVTA